jgi:hypothetical protein
MTMMAIVAMSLKLVIRPTAQKKCTANLVIKNQFFSAYACDGELGTDEVLSRRVSGSFVMT